MEKRIYKSPDKKISGLCAGFADYMNIDPVIVRLALVAIMLVTAVVPVVIVYLIVSAIVPQAPENYYQIFNNTSRRLTKSNDKKISGVCGGLAEAIGNIDPTLVRVLFVVVMLVTAVFPCLIMYIVAACIMPDAQPIENANAYGAPNYYAAGQNSNQQYNYAQPNGGAQGYAQPNSGEQGAPQPNYAQYNQPGATYTYGASNGESNPEPASDATQNTDGSAE